MTSNAARRAVGIMCMVATALSLAACGSDQSASQPAGLGDTGNTGIATKDLPGVGTVLVDATGKTLYFTDSDKADDIKCTAECLEMWPPAIAASDSLGASSDLSVVKRPDGSSQLAYQNKPLYTFTLDSSDKPASGHNATDSFGGMDFTWHAVVINSGGQQPPPNNGGGYGNGGGY